MDGPGRYTIEAATTEVRRAMSDRRPPGQKDPVSQKQLASLLRVSPGQVSHKIGLIPDRRTKKKRSSFSIEELGKIADLFHAPLGWPFLSWEVGEQAFKNREE